MALTVQNVYGLLLRSKLLSVDDARSIYTRWQNEAKAQADDLERFRRWLVGHHYLTEYQANLLCKGHADGFFISDYKVLERLGRGRMAGVYKAVHSLGQVLAVKVLPPSKAKDQYLLTRFQREAKLALRLKHVNVVRTFQLGEASGLHYIVMEYLEGETLEDILNRRKRLPAAEAVRLIYQVLVGLQHIHEQGLVHRDLKPSNLMITPARVSGQPDTTIHASVKILDIGLGREFFDENAAVPRDDQNQLTGEGVLLGTPDYLPPEQARNARGVDIRADIYSLGCVLYHCLAGNPPFPDTNIINQMIRHANETPKRLKELNPEVPDGLQQIIDWMIAKDPNQRYPTPERCAQAMQVFLASGTDAPRAPAADPSMTQYLQWLESGGTNGAGAKPAPPRPAAPAVPVSAPAVPPAGGVPAAKKDKTRGSRSGKKRHKSRRKSHQGQQKVLAGVPLPAKKKVKKAHPTGDGDFDVELVPVGAESASPSKFKNQKAAGGGFSRRDFFLLAIGAGSVAITGAVAGVAASGGVKPFLVRLGIMADAPEETPEDKKE